MKVFLKNVIIKKILIVFVTIIMISNFIMPNYVCASAGSKLVSGFFYLIAYLGDTCIKIMQEMMMGDPQIMNGDTYEIKYSPGVIFSNNVLALDIDFISPNTNILVKKDSIQEQTSVIASNTYSASRSGSTSSSGTNVVYEGVSEIGLSTTHTKGERWYTRETTRIIYNIWI